MTSTAPSLAALTDPVRAFLGEPRFAVVATTDADGTPQLSVVWYELTGDTLVFSTSVDNRKHRNLQRDPRLSVCVEDGYRYVVVRGEATFETEPDAVNADITRQAVRYLGPEQGAGMAAAITREPHQLVRVAITHATAYGFADPAA